MSLDTEFADEVIAEIVDEFDDGDDDGFEALVRQRKAERLKSPRLQALYEAMGGGKP